MGDDENHVQNVLVPVEQVEIPFYGHTLVAVRLPDGQIAAVLRWLCDGLQLDTQGQLQRIQRKTALTEGLMSVQVRTEGGPQTMPALTLDVLPGFLFTIDENRVNKAARADVILFQQRCVKVLAEYFTQQQPEQPVQPVPMALPAPTAVAPIEPPPSLAPHASSDERRLWRQMMREWLDRMDEIDNWRVATDVRQDALEARQDVVEERVGHVEEQVGEIARLVPEIIDKLGSQPLTPAHQAAIQRGVNLLNELTGAPHSFIYNDLRKEFKVAKYSQIPDTRWRDVVAWFGPRIRDAEQHKGVQRHSNLFDEDAPEQGSLF